MNITLNIPHSSINGFSDGWSSYSTLFKDVKRLTDWHTDVLFKPESCIGAIPIVFPYSRFKVDVERLVNDPLESSGQGILYTSSPSGCERTLTDAQRKQLMELYDLHHDLISRSVEDGSMLIDCHSFSNSTCDTIDVCIGYNEDETKPTQEIIDMVIDEFSRYVNRSRIAINKPFSNSIVAHNGKKHMSMMIELNKSLYMDENTLELNQSWYKYNSVLNSIYKKINLMKG